ncbi:hypothetical protein EV426DRAFT_107463 [Tirmania nivea]|nr:hypothetical protein EV426DRAFT_107463 [Tirmania nivea]
MTPKRPNRMFRFKLAPRSSESDSEPTNEPTDDSAVHEKLEQDQKPQGARIRSTQSFLAITESQKARPAYAQQAQQNAEMGQSSLTQIFRAVERNPQLLGEYHPPHSTRTGRLSQVRIKPTIGATPALKDPIAAAVPRKSILKKSTWRAGNDGDEGPPLRYRPEVIMEDSNFLYKPLVMPSMMNQRAITSVSIPKYCEINPEAGLHIPNLGTRSSIREQFGETGIVRRKQRWGRNVFLSNCGQFIIIHEFPVFDQNDGIGTFGDWVMGHATAQNSKIVIYRSHGKIAIMNEDLPQPDYGRSRKSIAIPGATQQQDNESDRGNSVHSGPAYYLHTNPVQSQWATDPQIVAEWEFPRDEIVTQVKVSMDIGRGSDGNV